MEFDVLIIGAGPAGLSAACRLKQLNENLDVCVLEKGSEVGAHIMSGAVFEPRALNELFPDWKDRGAPLDVEVKQDRVYFFRDQRKSLQFPPFLLPFTLHNQGNYIISLSKLCRWLAIQAEDLGVQIFPEFSAAEISYSAAGRVEGIITGEKGRGQNGDISDDFMPGLRIHARYTLFAEGCRGHLGKQLIKQFNLDAEAEPQHYGLGIKEIWRVPAEHHQPGTVIHTAGWPLNESGSHGGGFLYHLDNQQVAVGLVTDLSYQNPYLSPFEEFQRYKHHPDIRKYLAQGERLSYGARAITKGGIQSLPQLSFPGGLLIGDDAGTLNFAKIKGSHTAMKSGMVAAEVIVEAFANDQDATSLLDFDAAFKASWAYDELFQQRNFGPAQHKWGNFWGSVYSFFDLTIFRGRLPWTLSDKNPDHAQLQSVAASAPINYPQPDGKLSFDRTASVYLSNTNHAADQPCHLQLADATIPIDKNLPLFDEPAQRYCPAGVYEIVRTDEQICFKINAQNCVHCKTCDIKDPAQNITWVPPEGGGGPNYEIM